ncbi:MAG: biotin/lipoyl-containing protein [bacterium]
MDLIAKVGKTTHEFTIEPARTANRTGTSGGAHESGGDANGFVVRLGGATLSADLIALDGAGGYSLLLNGRPFDVRVLPGGAALRVGDRVIPIEIDDVRRFRARLAAGGAKAASGETVRSPMPGKIVSIPVAVGDSVRAGQTVAVVEAMKMQNELAAEGAGRVKEIRVAAGQVVDSGETLVILEGASA